MTKEDKFKIIALLLNSIIETCDDSRDDYSECKRHFKDLDNFLNKWIKDDR